jgi:ATP/ADP translocase/CRP-like cAMP-binding protein/HEAT repeat protein
MSLVQKVLSPVVELRRDEGGGVLMMFGYSFLAMTAYNIVQPITRSRFISSLGSDNIPYVLLVSAFIVGLIMQGYSRLGSLLPGRWVIPVTQAGMVALLVFFWVMFALGLEWIDVAFYLFGQIYGILLISQFWTLANLIYDARAAKRLFGFIGGGATAGGAFGASISAFFAQEVGSRQLVLVSAVALGVCAALVVVIIRRAGAVELVGLESAGEEKGVGGGEALRMLRESKHLQVIALTIALMSIGAGIIDQQLNMAVEAFKGRSETDAITETLAQVQVWVSIIGFVIQVWLTSRIHRLLGVGFALLILPLGLGATAVVILLYPNLWAPMFARVLDKSLRYTVDKTSREVLFLPLPAALKQKAKPFVDVTVDRFGRAAAALLLLLLIKPWALNLSWHQISYASLAVMVLWIMAALRAKRGYVEAFRRSIQEKVVQPEHVRLSGADLSTIETLVEELAHPDPGRVVYAIDVLESLDKRNLVTPLLLYHGSPAVRARALAALGSVRGDIAVQWVPHIRRMLGDPDAGVRAAAIGSLSTISHEDAPSLARPLMAEADPRIRATAAIALAGSGRAEDVDAAESALAALAGDTRDSARDARRDVATAVRQIANPRFKRLLIPLLYDPAPEVADEAMESVRAASANDFVFVPTLISLLRDRRLKGRARAVLVSYGEPVVDALAHFMRDPEEDVWVRRHIPATLAQIPSQKSVDVLIGALEEPDGFLRYKVVAALSKLRREHPELTFSPEPVEALVLKQARTYFEYLSLHYNLFGQGRLAGDSLLARALSQKMERMINRTYLLLTLLYPWRDIVAARWTIEHGDSRSRASASEYLDNILGGKLRKQVMPVLEEMPLEEKVRRANVLLRTRPRDVEETLLQLINDDDQVVAASAIEVARSQKIKALADDIEHVLAHRDVRDWYVFEAASWTLAEFRMPAERRRELWLEPLPAAELAVRLRDLPLFKSVTVDELFRVAGASRQVRHEPGTLLMQEGSVPAATHLLLDGQVACASRSGATQTITAPSAIGFAEVLQGTPSTETVRAAGIAVTLVLTADELRTLLSDNGDFVSGLFATLAERLTEPDVPVHSLAGARDFEAMAATGLSPIEKVLALQRVPLFSRVSADEMRHLANTAKTANLKTGEPLFAESAAPALWLILSGEVSLESSSGQPAVVARSGDVIGSIFTMAGRPLGRSADVLRSGVALRIDHEDLFETLGERPELLRQMFEGMFKMGGAAHAVPS